MKTYTYAFVDYHGNQVTGEQAAHNSATLLNMIAAKNPRVKKKNIKVWPPKKPKVASPIELHWRPHDGDFVRVWRSDWFGDQFEVMPIARFNELSRLCRTFSIPLVDDTGDDDDDNA